MKPSTFLCLFILMLSGYSYAQISPEKIKTSLETIPLGQLPQIENLKKFYALYNYQPVWICERGKKNIALLYLEMQTAADKALRPADYRIDPYLHPATPGDSLLTELKITAAAIHYYYELAYGNTTPVFGYDGLKFTPAADDIIRQLIIALQSDQLPALSQQLAVRIDEVAKLEKKLQHLNRIMTDSLFKETIVSSAEVSLKNKALLTKLHQLGFDTAKLTLPLLKQKIQEAQQEFNLLTDGLMRSTTIAALNVSIHKRQQQLTYAINLYKWLAAFSKTQATIVVNIPAAYLKVYHSDSVLLEMRMIVGKKSTPTPTLSSKVNEVVLYPYWHVPYSIATKELLPSIRRNPGYINAGNYQVLDRNGKIMNPYAINWSSLSTKNFPYLIRQSTGCDNALGLLKLNFYSPGGVYLHDTPNKSLFMLSKRFFSHGCMRMEKPMEMGHLVLKNNKIAIDTLEQKGCLRNQSPIHVPVPEPMPVIVWYNPAGTDARGHVVYFEDIYQKFGWKE